MRLDPGDVYLLASGRAYGFAGDTDAPVRDGPAPTAAHWSRDGAVRFGDGALRTIGMAGRFVFDDSLAALLLDLLIVTL